MTSHLPVATLYAAWFFLRSFLHRGWWLVTSLYLVSEASLSPLELVLLGTAQGITVILGEVPAGVLADACSRKWSLLLAHALMGSSMVATGLVLEFPALVLTQMVWGLSWTFSSGADVAWMTDELADPDRTPAALVAGAKWGHLGSMLGILLIGALAWSTSLSLAMVLAGAGMWGLGVAVLLMFPERNFRRAPAGEVLAVAAGVLRSGLQQLRVHRVLFYLLVSTFLVNGADEAFGRLHTKQLLDLGAPSAASPIVWFSLLAVLSLAVSVLALAVTNRILEQKSDYAGAYSGAALLGAGGLVALACSASFEVGALAVLLVAGVSMSVLRTVSVVWANHHANSEARATIQSFLSLAENLGEVSLGLSLAFLAHLAGIPAAMLGSSIVLLGVAVLVLFRIRRLD
ncbi:MAG: MFS transporter [Pseudomonadota bacterium]